MIASYLHALQLPAAAVLQLLLAFGLLAGAAILFFSRHRPGAGLAMLAGAGLLLRIYAASDLYLHAWDERYHALVAKHLVQHPLEPTLYENPVLPCDRENWTANHVWLHKPPVALWLMAASLAAFGEAEFTVRVPSILLSTLCILGIYGVGLRMTDKRSAFLAAMLFAVSGPVLDLVGGRAPVDHVDTVMLAWVLLGVWCAGKQVQSGRAIWLAPVGLVTGLALLTKSLPGLTIPAVWLVWSLGERKRVAPAIGGLLAILAVALAVIAPWSEYTRRHYAAEAAWERQYAIDHLFHALEGHAGGWAYHVSQLGRRFTEPIYAALIWLAVSAVRKPSARKSALAAWVAIPLVVFSVAATKMPSYTAIAWPALFLIFAAFWWTFYDALQRWPPSARRLRAVHVLLLAVGLLLPLRLTFERLKILKLARRQPPAWAQQLRDMAGTLPAGAKTVLVNTKHPIEAMFYADLTAYPFVPSPADLRDIQAKGCSVVAVDDGRLPDYVREDASVRRIVWPPDDGGTE